MGGNDLVPLNQFPDLPAGHNVGDTAILLDAAHLDLGDQFAVAIDKQLTILQYSLVPTNVEDYEIPLRVKYQDLAFQRRRQIHWLLQACISVQFSLQVGNFPSQEFVLRLDSRQGLLKRLVLGVDRGD